MSKFLSKPFVVLALVGFACLSWRAAGESQKDLSVAPADTSPSKQARPAVRDKRSREPVQSIEVIPHWLSDDPVAPKEVPLGAA